MTPASEMCGPRHEHNTAYVADSPVDLACDVAFEKPDDALGHLQPRDSREEA